MSESRRRCVVCDGPMTRSPGTSVTMFAQQQSCGLVCGRVLGTTNRRIRHAASRYTSDPVGQITMPSGQIVRIDPQDAESVRQFNWRLNRCGYVITRILGREVKLHRFVMKADHGQIVDHIDCDPLNNRRDNLRFVDLRESAINRRSRPGTASRFKGVGRHSIASNGETVWQVMSRRDGKSHRIGLFRDEVEAAHAYDNFARSEYGSVGRYNFPFPGEQLAVRDEIPFPMEVAA